MSLRRRSPPHPAASAPRPRVPIATAIISIALQLAACGDAADEAPKAQGPTPPTVVVTEVLRKTVPIHAEFVAQTEARSTVEIRARVAGILEEILFAEGGRVEEGQVLYRIETAEYDANKKAAQAQLARAQADLAAAKARLQRAEQDVARYRPLAEARAVPQQDLDTALAAEAVARAEVDQAGASIDMANAAITRADLDLGYTTIHSPIAGLVGRTEVHVGNLVGDGEATLLCTVSSIDPVRVAFSIPEADYLRLMSRHPDHEQRPQQPIDLVLADGSTYAHQGRTVFAERAVDLQTGTLEVIAEFPNPDGLIRPGQFGRVRLAADIVEDAVLVPERSVVEIQGARAVLVVDAGNMVALRSITPGERVGGLLIVRDGVEPGERVIVEGMQKARPGTAVLPKPAAPGSADKPTGR